MGGVLQGPTLPETLTFISLLIAQEGLGRLIHKNKNLGASRNADPSF